MNSTLAEQLVGAQAADGIERPGRVSILDFGFIVVQLGLVLVLLRQFQIENTACLNCREARHSSLVEIKRFCAEHLPLYMIPDQLHWHDRLPKTSTDKIDYQRLKEMH